MDQKHPYEDILHEPRPVSRRHSRMPPADRAAQFSPFAALTGYEDTIRETARLTDTEAETDETQIILLDRKIQLLAEHIAEMPCVTLTRFVPDHRKSGGAYRTETVQILKVDPIQRVLITTERECISMEHISALSGDFFSVLDTIP